MQIELTPEANSHLQFWRETSNYSILKRIENLLDSILQNPYQGIGKPELLKHQLKGKWSRRITQEHRFVYSVKNDKIIIYSLKGHY
jgi:toxin YoeB